MGDRRRILVVDDEAELRRLLAWILTDFGHDVETAADGEEVLARLPLAPAPDLVILDILMPRVDGWAVLRALRELSVQPPVLVLTGMVDYPTFLRAVREGAAAFMVKPFRFQDLIGLCQRLLGDGGEPPAQERRQTSRRLLITDIDLLSSEGKPLARGDLVNMSRAGARLDLGVPLDEGRRVSLAINIPGQGRPFRLDATVQWQRPVPTGFAHGVTFHTLGPEAEVFFQEVFGEY